jgi:pimeloyl-ACP methyl ester carboxylesterase
LHRLLPLLTHPDRRDDQALQMRLDAMMRRVGPETFVRQQTATASRVDSRPALAHITVPTCIIAGGADRVTPAEHAAEMAGCIRGASLHVLEPCAHLTPMEAPGRVGDIMRVWLQST